MIKKSFMLLFLSIQVLMALTIPSPLNEKNSENINSDNIPWTSLIKAFESIANKQGNLNIFNIYILQQYQQYSGSDSVKIISEKTRFESNKKLVQGLINHWSFDGNVNDPIGDANLYNGVNASFTSDRFGSAGKALRLSDGYYQAPQGIYFEDGDHTVSLWVRVHAHTDWSKIIDFGFSNLTNTVAWALSYGSSMRPGFGTTGPDASYIPLQASSLALNLNEWYHLVEVYQKNGSISTMYINGVQTASYQTKPIQKVVRDSNFIGKSNWANAGNVNADFDEIKIFNRSLSLHEILLEMNNRL